MKLGQMFVLGPKEVKDYARARAVLRKACDAGQSDGCHLLAFLLKRGWGGEKDEASARALESKVRAIRWKDLPRAGNFVVDSKKGTVTDTQHGLAWSRGASDEVHTLDEASAYCSALGLGGYTDWRLPDFKELARLRVGCDKADHLPCQQGAGPAKNGCYWEPGVWLGPCTGYWVRKGPGATTRDEARYLLFRDGGIIMLVPDRTKKVDWVKVYARCVRETG